MTPAERQQRSRRLAKDGIAAEQADILKKVVAAGRLRDQAVSSTDRWHKIAGKLHDLEELLLLYPPGLVEIDYADDLFSRVAKLLIRLKREARRVPFVDECDECHQPVSGRMYRTPTGGGYCAACRKPVWRAARGYSPGGWAAEP